MQAETLDNIAVVGAKLQVPMLGASVLRRPRLDTWLERIVQHPASLVVAPAGYGKTTFLAGLGLRDGVHLAWYTLGTSDHDPVVFLAHLCETLRRALSELDLGTVDRAMATLAYQQSPDAALALLSDQLAKQSGEIVVVLDDFHTISDARPVLQIVDWLLRYAPRSVHLVLSSRTWPQVAALPRLRASGRLVVMDSQSLRFTREEIHELMSSQGIYLSPEEITSLEEQTEGWVLVLRLAAQYLASGGGIQSFRASRSDAQTDLFEYLAEEVLDKQPEEIRDFMVQSSVLRHLTQDALEALVPDADVEGALAYLEAHDLFILRLDSETLRYHNLVQDFLQSRLRKNRAQWRLVNERAAAFYERGAQLAAAYRHWTMAQEWERAGGVLERLLPEAMSSSRFSVALEWLAQLPLEIRESRPRLLLYHAQILHALGRYHSAFDLYGQLARADASADLSLVVSAMTGRAAIYRDKGLIDKAAELYAAALRLVQPADLAGRAYLLNMLAVSDAATGDLASAEAHLEDSLRLYQDAGDLKGEFNVWNNLAQVVHVRRGRFMDATVAAQKALEIAAELSSPLRAAEANNTLATICYFTGDYARARELAALALTVGDELSATGVVVDALVTTAHTLGHGSSPEPAEADELYAQALGKLASLDSAHYLGLEAILGRAMLNRLTGNLAMALRLANQAVDSAARRGHLWLKSICRLEQSAVYHRMGNTAAAGDGLAECVDVFELYGDNYHLAASLLWSAALADGTARRETLGRALRLVTENGYIALLNREWQTAVPLLIETLGDQTLGPLAEQLLSQLGTLSVPALLDALPSAGEAQQRIIVEVLSRVGDERARQALRPLLQNKLLKPVVQQALDSIVVRPEHNLRIRMLGSFSVARGDEVIPDREWRTSRIKALLQILASNRGKMMSKERLIELLWPDLDLDSADNNFRFTLSALNKILEPRRPEGAAPYYIQRRGDTYTLSAHADVFIDVEDFERLVRDAQGAYRGSGSSRTAAIELYRRALELYSDDYLPELLFEDWTVLERERLRELYFSAASQLGELLLIEGQYDAVIQLARGILQRDTCREDAYRVLMRAHWKRGDRTAALRAYQQCVAILDEELGVQPLPETSLLYRQIRAGG